MDPKVEHGAHKCVEFMHLEMDLANLCGPNSCVILLSGHWIISLTMISTFHLVRLVKLCKCEKNQVNCILINGFKLISLIHCARDFFFLWINFGQMCFDKS